MDALTQIVTQASDFLWNVILIIILCGTGIYYTIRLKFIQVRKFREGWHQVFGSFSLKGAKGKAGEMTSFQSVATAIAAQVGTGNLAGAATALIGGGPGAIFWMWLSAFFGMSTIYAEATLAQKYKTKKDGVVTGGPVYYIRAAFTGKFGKVLAGIFAVLIIIALGFTGNMVQSNSIGSAFYEVFRSRGLEIPQLVFGLILAAITVKFRDVMHLYSVFVTVVMYLTPVIYPMSILPDWLTVIVKINPLTNYLTMFRDLMMNNRIFTAGDLLVGIVEAVVALVLGLYVFYKNQDTFILNL